MRAPRYTKGPLNTEGLFLFISSVLQEVVQGVGTELTDSALVFFPSIKAKQKKNVS